MSKYKYLRGSFNSFEAIEFHITKNGQYVTTCIINVPLLLAGIKVFHCNNGEDISLSSEQQLEILEYLQAERKKITDSFSIKTYESWLQSGLSFYEYCFPGDEVDETIVDNFVNEVPPVTLGLSCTQIGEAYSMEPDKDGRYRTTYMTFHSIGNKRWIYDGLCFKDSTENRVDKPYNLFCFEKLIEEVRSTIK